MTLQTAKNKVNKTVKSNEFAKRNGLRIHVIPYTELKNKLSFNDALKFQTWCEKKGIFI